MRAPLYIRMRDEDNVAIVANDGLQLIEQIPQGHKVALADIAADGVIRRYGEVIGHALRPIARGDQVWHQPHRRSAVAGRTGAREGFTGEATIEEVGWEIFRLMLDVASGLKKTWAETWEISNALALFNPGPVT